MALPAGRYGVTKNQLLKIKKLPMNTIKLIEELTEKFDLLGTAAFKNSTSVVTQSTDLVESGAVYDVIGFGNKNLFDKNAGNILNGFINNNTGEIVANNDTRVIYCPCEPNTTYTISKISTSRFFVGWTNTKPTAGGVANDVIVGYGETYITITTGSTASYIVAFVWRAESDTGITVQSVLDSVQIEKGSTATAYEPYYTPLKDVVPTKVSYADNGILGAKNLLGLPYHFAGSYIINNDGSVTIPANTYTSINLILKQKNLDYEFFSKLKGLNLKLTGGVSNDISLYIWKTGGTYVSDVGDGAEFVIDDAFLNTNDYNMGIHINAQTLSNSVTIKPMICLASDTDPTYQPYAQTNRELTVNKANNSVIGTVEDGTNPTKSYAVNEFMVRDGAFCQVTVPVTTSSTWTEGSNYTKKSIAEVLQSLMS